MFVCVGKFSFQIVKLNVRENRWGNQEWTIQRDTGKIGHTRRRKRKQKKHNITQKTKKMSNTDPTKN